MPARAHRAWICSELHANGLHTHLNQDRYGDDQLICYAIFNFWDMVCRRSAPAPVRAHVRTPTLHTAVRTPYGPTLHTPSVHSLCTRSPPPLPAASRRAAAEQGRGSDCDRAWLAQTREGRGDQRDEGERTAATRAQPPPAALSFHCPFHFTAFSLSFHCHSRPFTALSAFTAVYRPPT